MAMLNNQMVANKYVGVGKPKGEINDKQWGCEIQEEQKEDHGLGNLRPPKFHGGTNQGGHVQWGGSFLHMCHGQKLDFRIEGGSHQSMNRDLYTHDKDSPVMLGWQ